MCLKYLSFFFTLIFFIQSSAWAFSGPATSKNLPAVLEKFNSVSQFNSLSQNEKLERITEFAKFNPVYEKFFTARIEDLGNQAIPKYSLDRTKILFNYLENSYAMEFVGESTISFMGLSFELAADRIESSYQEFLAGIETKLGSKETAFLDYIIPSARANSIDDAKRVAMALGAFVALAAAVLAASAGRSCKKSMDCLTSFESESTSHSNSVDGSSRSIIKDVFRSPFAPKIQSSRSSQQ